jgi:hypothetical protein
MSLCVTSTCTPALDAGVGMDASPMDTGTMTATDAPKLVFGPRCAIGGCHGVPLGTGGLDLQAPNLVARLSNKTSTTALCGGHVILKPGDPEGSLIYQKLLPTFPCGTTQMPVGVPLPPDQIAIVHAWIMGLQ